METVKKVRSVLVNILATIGAALFVCLLLIVCVQIVARFTEFTVAWTEEGGRLVFGWLVFIGAAAASGQGSHLAADFVAARLKPPFNKILSALVSVFSIAIAALFMLGCSKMYLLQQGKPFSAIPLLELSWKYAVPVFSFAMMILFALLDLVALIPERGGKA